MSSTIVNIANSFVTFRDLSGNGASEYITDTECGIQKDFCYPIYDEKDLRFQTAIASTTVLTTSNVTIFRFIEGSPGQTPITGEFINIATTGTLSGVPIYNIFFEFSSSDLTDGLSDGDCFTITILVDEISSQTLFISNQCFKKVDDKCLTSRITYVNTSNAFGFDYRSFGTFPLIGFTANAIRLPLYFKEPIISSEKNVYVRSDGTRDLLSARLSKRYKGMIDEVPEETHQKLVIALNHDAVWFAVENGTIRTDGAEGIRVRFEDEYNNNFPEIMQNVNIWSADFTIFETPFNNFNSNCG